MKILLIVGGIWFLSKLLRRTDDITNIVRRTARAFDVPSRLIFAIIQVESGGDAKAVGRAGEIGLMQILPETARMTGYEGPTEGLFDPATNIFYGTAYLAWWRDKGCSLEEAVAGYNAGKVERRAGRFINQEYVDKVMAEYNRLTSI